MDFSDILKRANIDSLASYILNGCESLENPDKRSFSDRLKAVETQMSAFFSKKFPDFPDYDEVSSHFYALVDEYKNVFFEIGVIAGAKIAFQLNDGIDELK